VTDGVPSRGGPSSAKIIAAVVLAAVVLVPLNLFTIGFVAAEQTLYRADQLAYWSYSAGLAHGLTHSPVSAVAAIADSVANQELNLLPATPIAASMTVFGTSRLAYLGSVLNIYGAAVVVALLICLFALRDEDSSPRVLNASLSAAFSILMLPDLWYPVFKGYLGLGGVALGIVILGLYLRRSPESLGIKELLLIGFLVGMLSIFRRWYTFWSVAFCVVVGLESLRGAWGRRATGVQAVVTSFRAPAVIGLSAIVTIALLAGPVAIRRLAPGYAEEFVGFARSGGLGDRIAPSVTQFGELTLLTALVAVILMMIQKGAGRRIATVIGIHLLLTYFMMLNLQDHDPQHWYLYSAGLLVLMGVAGMGVLGSMKTVRSFRITAALALLVGVVVTATVFLPTASSLLEAAGPMVPGLRIRPAVRTDIPEVHRLLGTLDRITARRPGYIYVIGCTSTLSEQSLAFANLSLGTSYRAPAMILQSAHVDRRDGFPSGLIQADYVVVADPVQVNLDPSQQQVVILPNQSFLNGVNIAGGFSRVPGDYHFEGGVSVSVYERIRPTRSDDIAGLSDLLRAKYPDRPDIYLPRGEVVKE